MSPQVETSGRSVLDLDAMGQAELVRDGQISPRELVETAIARAESLNPSLNAVVTPCYEAALAAAPSATGLFAGVPFMLKDLFARLAGVRLTEGSRSLADYVPSDSSKLVSRYLAAGLVILGKTNTSEFGATPVTEGTLFGPARNPWRLGLTAGGSSGGAAVAVATGMVPIAHGNDGGGSLRIPASCCGVFGLKPSRGRNPVGPEYPDLHARIITEHVITRSVRDSAAVLDATAGPPPGAPYAAPAPTRPWVDEVARRPRRLRIAASWKPAVDVPVDGDCRAALASTIGLCEELGHEVVGASPALDAESTMEAWFSLWAESTALFVEEASRRTGSRPAPGAFEELTWTFFEHARSHSFADHQQLLRVLGEASRALNEFFDDFDVWLTPTLAQPPLELGAFHAPEDTIARYLRFAPYTRLANIGGLPAMSVPLHMSSDGLPIGSHFAASYGDEATLFRLAGQLEEARPWVSRRPSVGGETA